MNRAPLTRLAAVAVLVAAAACSSDGPTQPLDERAPDPRLASAGVWAPTHSGATAVYLCKLSWETVTGEFPDFTTGQSFDFEVTVDDGTATPYTLTAQTWVDRASSACALVYQGPAGAQVVMRELAKTGSTLESVSGEYAGFDVNMGQGYPTIITSAPRTAMVTTTAATNQNVAIIYFKNSTEEPEEELAEGRMTGGGVKAMGIDADGNSVRVTLGLTLHCDNLLSNNLEVNWPHRHQWHIKKESLESVRCTKPDDPTPPVAPISRFEATAIGRLDGGDFDSLIEFVFEDLGEPGREDRIQMKIYPGLDNTAAPVLIINSQTLAVGNFQMHYDQPHGQKPPRR
jgi:hypothetical protein